MVKSNISSIYAEGSTAVLTLENGAKNLLTEPEFIDTDVFCKWMDEHPELTSLVITGAGRHFSHGADVSLFSGSDTDGISRKLEKTGTDT